MSTTLHCQSSSSATVNLEYQAANGLRFYYAATSERSEIIAEYSFAQTYEIDFDASRTKFILWGTYTDANRSHPENSNIYDHCGAARYFAALIGSDDLPYDLELREPFVGGGYAIYRKDGARITSYLYTVNGSAYGSKTWSGSASLMEPGWQFIRTTSQCTYNLYEAQARCAYANTGKINFFTHYDTYWQIFLYNRFGNKIKGYSDPRKPSSVEAIEGLQTITESLAIEKQADTEAIQIIEEGNCIEILKIDLLKGNITLIKRICSINQPVIYSVECGQTDECPENTCPVLCGNTVCCYDSNGISQFSYPV